MKNVNRRSFLGGFGAAASCSLIGAPALGQDSMYSDNYFLPRRQLFFPRAWVESVASRGWWERAATIRFPHSFGGAGGDRGLVPVYGA